MRFAFIAAEKAQYPVRVLCSVLAVSRSGFYAWQRRAEPKRRAADRQLGVEVVAIHKQSRKTYGSPRIHQDLQKRGVRVGRKRIERVLREQGLEGRRPRRYRRTTDSGHSLPVVPNRLERKFEVACPNRVWVGDITYLQTAEGSLYLAVLLDLFSRRVVGWALSPSLERGLALEALARALSSRRPPAGLIHHSDRGSQYASLDYREQLAAHRIEASMSRKGNCWDNAVAESFFATLKVELVTSSTFTTFTQAERAIADYIDNFYNRQRRHSTLDYLCPVEFELRAQRALMAA